MILGLQKENPLIFSNQDRKQQITFFGVDFFIDSEQRVWLIEVNHGPYFPIESDHDLQQSLCEVFWRLRGYNFVMPAKKAGMTDFYFIAPLASLDDFLKSDFCFDYDHHQHSY